MKDDITKVKISKTDITNGGKELPGATMQILIGDEVVKQWISGTEPYYVTGLKTGVTYTLRETIAPDGYAITSDTTFSIDEKTGEVTSSGTVSNGRPDSSVSRNSGSLPRLSQYISV